MKKTPGETDDTQILVGWLGQGDALHEALRRSAWSSPRRVSAVVEARVTFASKGLPLRAARSNDAEQKRVERMHDALEEAGLVIFCREHGRRTNVRVADAIEWRLRRVATWSGFSEMLVVMQAIATHEAAGHTNAGHVPEWAVAGVTDKTTHEKAKRLSLLVEEYALPALVRGWLTSWSDIHGAVGYALTDAGRELLQDPPEPPDVSGVDYDDSLNDVFLESLKAGREWVANLPPHQAVAIPLSAGDWPDDETLTTPSVFDSRGQIRTPPAMAKAIQQSKR
jgi:hypothetical protein